MILKGHDSVLQTNGIFFKSQVTPLMILVPVEILNPNAGGLFPDKLLAVTTRCMQAHTLLKPATIVSRCWCWLQ